MQCQHDGRERNQEKKRHLIIHYSFLKRQIQINKPGISWSSSFALFCTRVLLVSSDRNHTQIRLSKKWKRIGSITEWSRKEWGTAADGVSNSILTAASVSLILSTAVFLIGSYPGKAFAVKGKDARVGPGLPGSQIGRKIFQQTHGPQQGTWWTLLVHFPLVDSSPGLGGWGHTVYLAEFWAFILRTLLFVNM